MSGDEIRTRAAQEIAKRWDVIRHAVGYKFIREIPPAPPSVPGRFFFESVSLPGIIAILRERLPEECEGIIQEAERILQHQFELLGYGGLDYGKEIDWHLDAVHGKRAPLKPWYRVKYLDFNQVGDHKITWELNRHQHLVALAKAWLLTKDDRFAAEIFRQWYSWQKANPYPIGINWASSLEVAMRSLAWIWVERLTVGCAAAPASFPQDLARALRLNGQHIARYISTYFSPNTHLLGEGVGLFFIGTMHPEFPESPRWRQTGWKVVLDAAEQQVRPDGFYFEQSVYYHVYALDFFLHARLLAAQNGMAIPRTFEERLARMLEALRVLGQQGPPPRIGDDDGGRVFNPRRNLAEHLLDPLATGAALFGRPGLKEAAGGLREETVWLLGRDGVANFDGVEPKTNDRASVQLGSSGIYVMANPAKAAGADTGASKPRRMIVVTGPEDGLSCGHAHADALSVHVSVEGREWLIDPGSGSYLGDLRQRAWFRGSAAHNTMRVDNLDQGDTAGPFAWGSNLKTKIESWVPGETFDLISASHTGYARLPKPVTHQRVIFSVKDRFWLVEDSAQGSAEHEVEIAWHLAAGFAPVFSGEKPGAVWTRGEEALLLLAAEGHRWSQEMAQGQDAPVYGRIEPGYMLSFRTQATLPAHFALLISPLESAAQPLGRLEQTHEENSHDAARGYRYAVGDETHYLFLSNRSQRWQLGEWSSDAQALYCSIGQERIRHWVLSGGSFSEIEGHRVIDCGRNIERFEWWSIRGREKIASSDDSVTANAISAEAISAAEKTLIVHAR